MPLIMRMGPERSPARIHVRFLCVALRCVRGRRASATGGSDRGARRGAKLDLRAAWCIILTQNFSCNLTNVLTFSRFHVQFGLSPNVVQNKNFRKF